MIDEKIKQLQRERELLPATFEIIGSINQEHKITRAYVLENGAKIDKLDARMDNLDNRMDSLEGRVENLEKDVKEIKSDVSELKSDVSELKDGMNQILQILKKEG